MTAVRLIVTTVWLSLALSSLQAATGDSDTVIVKDPHYGEVLFYFYQEEYFPAIVHLLAAQKRTRVNQHVDEAQLLRGGLNLSYGNHRDAAEIFESLLASNVTPEVRDRTWFFLAKIWFQRGYLDESQQALDEIKAELPKNLHREAVMLQAQILIDTKQFDRAIALLQQWNDHTDWASYAKFNLGVALVRSGRVDAAARILDGLGSISANDEELMSLRDRANLALGYALIQDRQPAAAKTPLQRVRLAGPFSNKALLGVGWADAELSRYHRALVPWMELHGRDLLDPAVQESMLAIPYALAQLDSISQSADYYLNAVEAFFEEIKRIDRTIARIESGDVLDELLANEPLDSAGWYWRLDELPEGAEGRYLYHLLATHKFQEGLKNYRDLRYLYRNLDNWQKNIDVFTNMLDSRRLTDERDVEDLSRRVDNLEPRITGLKIQVADAMVEQRVYLQSIAIGGLRAQKERLDIYTVQARFALAAIYDLAATAGEVGE